MSERRQPIEKVGLRYGRSWRLYLAMIFFALGLHGEPTAVADTSEPSKLGKELDSIVLDSDTKAQEYYRLYLERYPKLKLYDLPDLTSLARELHTIIQNNPKVDMDMSDAGLFTKWIELVRRDGPIIVDPSWVAATKITIRTALAGELPSGVAGFSNCKGGTTEIVVIDPGHANLKSDFEKDSLSILSHEWGHAYSNYCVLLYRHLNNAQEFADENETLAQLYMLEFLAYEALHNDDQLVREYSINRFWNQLQYSVVYRYGNLVAYRCSDEYFNADECDPKTIKAELKDSRIYGADVILSLTAYMEDPNASVFTFIKDFPFFPTNTLSLFKAAGVELSPERKN